MFKSSAKQKLLFKLENAGEKPMQIVCEPACSEYQLQPGSKIVFRAESRESREGIPPIIAEYSDYGLTIWFEDALYEPDAEIDGVPTEPFNW